MARYERNRGMYFGAWTMDGYSESAIVTGDFGATGTGAPTAVLAEGGAADFGTKVNKISGEYQFFFNGTTWELNSEPITIADYGITVTGTPANGDMIDVNYTAESGAWEAIGKDNDDLSKELNPDTETSKNVLGESTFRHSGYEPSVSVDPYYIDPSRKLYKRILKNAIEERYGESELKGFFAEAFFTVANKERRTMSGYAYVREAWFVPQSTGGDTTAYAIPIEIHPVGPTKKYAITYMMDTNEATLGAELTGNNAQVSIF